MNQESGLWGERRGAAEYPRALWCSGLADKQPHDETEKSDMHGLLQADAGPAVHLSISVDLGSELDSRATLFLQIVRLAEARISFTLSSSPGSLAPPQRQHDPSLPSSTAGPPVHPRSEIQLIEATGPPPQQAMSETPLLAGSGAGEEKAQRALERKFAVADLGYCQPSTWVQARRGSAALAAGGGVPADPRRPHRWHR